MRRCLILSIALFGCFLTSLSGNTVETQDYIVQTANGYINWTKGWIQASGSGNPSGSHGDSAPSQEDSEKTAHIAAQENLLKIIESVRIYSNKSVGDLIYENPDIRSRLIEMIQALRPPQPPQFRPDGSVVIRLQMPLHGPFAQLMLPPDIKQIEPIRRVSPIRPSPATPSANDKSNSESGEILEQKQPVLSGMIVDAKGLEDVQPVMVPKIVDETGNEVYGPAFVSREYAIQSGMVSYMKNIAPARRNARVKPNPLIVKGLKTERLGRTSIVVSNADASKLRHASENLSFLKQCRVIIILD